MSPGWRPNEPPGPPPVGPLECGRSIRLGRSRPGGRSREGGGMGGGRCLPARKGRCPAVAKLTAAWSERKPGERPPPCHDAKRPMRVAMPQRIRPRPFRRRYVTARHGASRRVTAHGTPPIGDRFAVWNEFACNDNQRSHLGDGLRLCKQASPAAASRRKGRRRATSQATGAQVDCGCLVAAAAAPLGRGRGLVMTQI